MAFGIVLPQTVILTESKSSFSKILATLQRGAIVTISEDLADGWLAVTDQATGITGNTPSSNLQISEQQPSATPVEDKTYTVLVNTPAARLRAGAGVEFPIVTVVKQDTSLKVIGQEGDWLKINHNNVEAYISAHLTQRRGTVKDTVAFLSDEPDLVSLELKPTKRIPLDGLTPKTRKYVAAEVWNNYGGLMEALSTKLAVPLASMVAVVSAESSGKAFGDDGRLIIRFEVHLFKKFFGEKDPIVFDRHFQSDGFRSHKFRPSDTAEWGAVHTNQKREWEVLTFARGLDDMAALRSISMGAPQIMGFNFKTIGYETVQAMFDEFSRSAHSQILGMFDFVRGGGSISQAVRALQTGDFLTFASIYNGPANAQTYETIIEEYIAIFNQLIPLAKPVAVPDVQRGPQFLPGALNPATVTEVAAAQNPPSKEIADTVKPLVVSVTPVQADIVITTTMQVNVRSEPSTKAKALGALEKGASLRLTELVESALDKISKPESAQQFINVEYNGQQGHVAAWLCIVNKLLTQTSIDAYINSLPQRDMPPGYKAFWAQKERLGLPDPFDIMPVQVRSEADLVNMQVNGFGPNTFSMWNGAKWYSRIGYMHNGYDFISKTGTPLIAVSDGIIIKNWVFMANKAEKTVVLWCYLPERFKDAEGRRMMSNVLIAMGHLSNGSVRQNHEVVRKGDVIGHTGTPAGSSSNDHLHYEIHLINGDPNLPNPRGIKMLREYKGDQNAGNNTPWNALMFYTPRLVNYSLHQGETIGFLGKFPEYPTRDMLKQNGSLHLDPLAPLTLAYYRYGIPNVWKPNKDGTRWGKGVVMTEELEGKLASIPSWVASSF